MEKPFSVGTNQRTCPTKENHLKSDTIIGYTEESLHGLRLYWIRGEGKKEYLFSILYWKNSYTQNRRAMVTMGTLRGLGRRGIQILVTATLV